MKRTRAGKFLKQLIPLLCAALLPGLAPAIEGMGTPARTNGSEGRGIHRIILITIDALRADHVSCYGYSRPTTPFLDEVAAGGVCFSQAYATASWTVPSMASLFLGLSPRDHGVQHGVVHEVKRKILHQEVLPLSAPTLAERLRAAGYTTFGISANGHLSAGSGFDRGFDYFRCLWFASSPAPNQAAEAWMDAITTASNAFVWIHYFDPHDPYSAHEPWLSRYAKNLNACKYWSEKVMVKLSEKIPSFCQNPGAKDALIDLYDSEINYADAQVKALLEKLAWDTNALVIITSDHGEEFMDHNGLGHGTTLYEELVRVPLIIRGPGCPAGKVVQTPVSLVDLPATVLDWVGVPSSGAETHLHSLLVDSEEDSAPQPVYLELDRDIKRVGLRLADWKLIVSDQKNEPLQLFNLRADPGEKNDRHREESETADHLNQKLQPWLNQRIDLKATSQPMSLSPKEIQVLRSLGYTK